MTDPMIPMTVEHTDRWTGTVETHHLLLEPTAYGAEVYVEDHLAGLIRQDSRGWMTAPLDGHLRHFPTRREALLHLAWVEEERFLPMEDSYDPWAPSYYASTAEL